MAFNRNFSPSLNGGYKLNRDNINIDDIDGAIPK